MKALSLPPEHKSALLPLSGVSGTSGAGHISRCLIVGSDDEKFWHSSVSGGSELGRKLIRKGAATGATDNLRLLKPAAVLVDLDLPAATAWDAADALLRTAKSPPLLLLTSRSDHIDFNTAIQ